MMEVTEILLRFERFNGKFEREAVEAAIARREEVIPGLLAVLEKIADPVEAVMVDAEDNYMAHLYAMYLLAQFRETPAFPLVLRIALLPGGLLESLFGDFITSGLSEVLASVCGGQIEEIQSIVEKADADEWVRVSALTSLVTLVAAGIKSREEILDYFAGLFRGKLTDKNEVVWSFLVVSSIDLFALDLLGDIERAYEEGLIDEQVVDLDEVRDDLDNGEAWALERLANDPHQHLIDDTVKEMGWWACFNEEQPRERREEALEGVGSRWVDSTIPYQRATPKVGRNDPCPCGSGKKYKKCCGG